MKNMVRCKACGYIMSEAKLGDRCPACGALRVAFEPYSSPIAEPRLNLLNLDLHPVAVHFPTSFAVAVLILQVLSLFFGGEVQTLLFDTTKILSLVLPVFILGAISLGVLDGKVRFRKIKNSLILKQKLVYGSLFFVFASGLAVIVWLIGFNSLSFTIISMVLSGGMVAFSTILGLLGSSIKNAAFPGK